MLDIFAEIHREIMDVDRIPFLVGAIFICSVVGVISGPAQGKAYPFLWIILDRLVGNIGDRLNKQNRSEADLVFRGFVFAIVLVSLFFMLGLFVQHSVLYAAYFEFIIICSCLSVGSVWYTTLKLFFALSKDVDKQRGFLITARSSDCDLNSLDQYGITRQGISLVAVMYDKALVAPSLWYLIGGLPLLLMSVVLSFLAWRFDGNRGFDRVILALDKLFGFVPSLFSGLLFTLSAAVAPSANILKSLSLWCAVQDRLSYKYGGFSIGAIAWSLNIALGGPVTSLKGDKRHFPWIGPDGASAKVDPEHLKRGLVIGFVAYLIFVVCLLSAYLYGSRFS